MKKSGVRGFPHGDAALAFEKMNSILKENGIYVVPVGELESFIPTVGGHGPNWVNSVLETYPDLENSIYNEIKLRIQKKQMEDAEIIKAIRSMKMDSRKMLTFLDGIQNGTVTMQFDEEGNLSMDSSETGIKKEENMDREMSTGLIEEREDLEDEE